MSERLPYEQHLHQQWTEVPLPDEDMAWADMRRRLEKDDDDGIIFWWRPGCGIIALLLLLLGGLGWWVLRDKEGKEEKKEKKITEQVVKDSVVKKRSNNNSNKNIAVDSLLLDTNESGSRVKETERVKEKDISTNEPEETKNEITSTRKDRRPMPKKMAIVPGKQKRKRVPENGEENDIVAKKTVSNETVAAIDSTKTETATPTINSTDSTQKKPGATKKKTTDSAAVKKTNPPDSSKPKAFFFSAGVSVQQQLPIAGQKASPYNSLGRKSTLMDYIPSVYVRLNRKDKWFLQAEFKYGAPQYTKEYVYHQTVEPDTPSGPPRFLTTTSNKLKKSFYHQLPFTFNYYAKPNWSVGGGLQWNKFYGAVSDREVIEHNVANGTDQVLSKGIVVTKTDSTGSFMKSYFQAVLESQYRWKQFSFGARYTFGLQPYITVTLPNRPDRKEKNSNVLIFVRYEFWRQKR